MKLDLEIIEQLGEFVDQELKFGCYFVDKKYWLCMILKYVRTWSSSSEWYDWRATKKWEMVFSDYRPWELKFVILRTREVLTMRVDESIEYINDENIRDTFKIIWQYHLWSILRWLESKWIRARWVVKGELYVWPIGQTAFALDITKPPMERSDKQKQELIDFMKKILSVKK